MSLFPLNEEEWKLLHDEVPNPNSLIDRVVNWPPAEWTHVSDYDVLKRVRLSSVRFHDAIEKLRNARYSLGQAIAIRKYYLDKKEIDHDENHVLADWQSRFYADYVPLQLTSAVDHTLDALLDLYSFRDELKTYAGKYRLKKVRNCFEDKLPGSLITSAFQVYDESKSRSEIWRYRDDWVHNKPPRVESILYNPAYTHGVDDRQLTPWRMVLMGGETDPDYKWDQFIVLLKDGLSEAIPFINQSTKEWEVIYTNAGGKIDEIVFGEDSE